MRLPSPSVTLLAPAEACAPASLSSGVTGVKADTGNSARYPNPPLIRALESLHTSAAMPFASSRLPTLTANPASGTDCEADAPRNTHHFTCIVRADHPVTRSGNTKQSMAQFLEYGHAVVRAEGRSQELYERFLVRKRIRRKPALLTPHFMSIPFILARTDLIATVPHAVGLSFMQSHANICVMEPPLELPSFDLKQHWHRKFHNDARSQWLRALVTSLFNDEADEWHEPGYPPAKRKHTR